MPPSLRAPAFCPSRFAGSTFNGDRISEYAISARPEDSVLIENFHPNTCYFACVAGEFGGALALRKIPHKFTVRDGEFLRKLWTGSDHLQHTPPRDRDGLN
jgi:hypothetical protein